MTSEPGRFDTEWVEYAREQFNSLAPAVHQAVMALVGKLAGDPDPTRYGTYHEKFDNYRTNFAYGLITYTVVAERKTVILLRITVVEPRAPTS
ncbi:MAG: type II toxin-antitoxin system RelE family toxin [Pseudonocardiaceae bacterium]